MGGTVQVTAEWALWVMAPGDAGYRLQACSDGAVSPGNYEDILTRYSPGTLDSLPQVTIGCFSDRGREDYLTLAIHESVVRNLDALDRAARRQPETDSPGGGREIMQISYFCVPFRELATGTVSYADLYEGLRGRQLPRERRALILAAARPAAAPDGRGML